MRWAGYRVSGDAVSTKDLIIAECKAEGVLRNQAAYVLATADWETNHTFEPVREAYWVKNAEAWRKKNLRYYPWYGRGLVQLTWEDNYRRAGKAIGVDLIKNPDGALEAGSAVKILVKGMIEGWFTSKKLSDYITLKRSEFIAARAIINGKDKAQEIAALAMKYDDELLAAGYGVDEGWTTDMNPREPAETRNWFAALLQIIASIVGLFLKGLGRK